MNNLQQKGNPLFSSILNFNNLPLVLFACCTIVYLIGLYFIDVMDIDSSQYAAMSLQMMENHEYLQVKLRTNDYLDKPPLLFWLSSLFYSVFGVSHFAFRLPSFLFTILGTYSTFKLGTLLYDKKTGLIASLVLYSCQAYFLFNHDVRTDCLLTNSIIFAVWQLYAHIKFNKLINFLGGFLGIALAMLAKGPIGLVVPALAIGSHLLIKKDFKTIFQLKWIAGILLVLLILSPMVYGLYQQHGIKGVKFYFWTQSFGRITGESEWKNEGSTMFFTHTFLWSFLPWTIFALGAIFIKIKTVFNKTQRLSNEFITIGGFVLSFIALSLSKYKLPHYIFVVYPFAAIFTAHYITTLINNNFSSILSKIILGFQWFTILLFVGFPLIIMLWIFPTSNIFIWIIYSIFILTIVYFTFKKYLPAGGKEKIILVSVFAAINLNFILNFHFYPTLFTYQSGATAARFLNEQKVEKKDVVYFNMYSYAFDFYFRHNVDWVNSWENIKERVNEKKELWVFADEEGYKQISDKEVKILFTKKIENMRVANLTGTFLNPATRKDALSYTYVVKLEKLNN